MIRIYHSLQDILKDKDLYPFYDNESLIYNLIEKLNKKFEFHIKNTKTFIGELYKEREWTKLYSIHYGQIFNSKVINKTIRIHLFSEKIEDINHFSREMTDDDSSYLGYFTIRPLSAVSGSISRARLKIFKKQYDVTNEERYINFVYVSTNLYGKNFNYPSFPFIAQDNVVSVCAHADILMLSKYMYKKFNFNLIEIDTILSNIESHNGRKIPSDGLVLEQILRVLEKNRYNPSLFRAKGDKIIRFELTDKIKPIDMFEIIDVAIRSGLTLMLAISSHVIIINGYFYKRNKKHYIIYDDSSYYIKKMTGKHSYSEAIEESKIGNFLNDIYNEKKEETYLIIPTFDRFYFRYPSLYILIHLVLKKYIEKNYEDISLERLKYKATLVDSIKLKKELKNNILDIDMPHYVWYIEWFDNEEKIGFSIIDATAHKNDIYYSSIIKFKEM